MWLISLVMGWGCREDTCAFVYLSPRPLLTSLLFSCCFPVSGGARLHLETQMEPVKFSTATESVLLLQIGKLREAQAVAWQGPLHRED